MLQIELESFSKFAPNGSATLELARQVVKHLNTLDDVHAQASWSGDSLHSPDAVVTVMLADYRDAPRHVFLEPNPMLRISGYERHSVRTSVMVVVDLERLAGAIRTNYEKEDEPYLPSYALAGSIAFGVGLATIALEADDGVRDIHNPEGMIGPNDVDMANDIADFWIKQLKVHEVIVQDSSRELVDRARA